MRQTLSVIISTHDRPESLHRTACSLIAQSRKPDEVIIVNDGPCDTPDKTLHALIQSGISGAALRQDVASLPVSRNRGLASARSDIVLLADDDVVLPRDYLQRLMDIYESDASNEIHIVGATFRSESEPPLPQRVWKWCAESLFAQNRWGPRRIRSRYYRGNPSLCGKLIPARFASGGTISLRRKIASRLSFESRFAGYALGEDMEFCFRATQRYRVFIGRNLEMLHLPGSGGRPDLFERSRHYVRNTLHIARCATEGGAGTWVLLGWNWFGQVLLYTLYAALGNRRNFRGAAGMLYQAYRETMLALRRAL